MTTHSTGSNWAGNVTYGAAALHEPTSVEELQEVVARSSRVRPVGSRHSFNRIADTDHAQVSVAGLPPRVEIDESEREVTVSGGLRYGELVQRLDDAGWALHNLASLPHISVAGAIATGTHGSGDRNGSLASAVSAIGLVGADGELRDVSRGDADFDGMVVALGALGVVTSVSLDIQPAFKVRQDVFEHLPWSDVADHFDEITSAAYSVSMFTDWNDVGPTSVWLKSRHQPRSDLFGARPAVGALHPLPGIDPESTTVQLGQPGPWWDRLPHFRLAFTPSNGDELQTEYLVPRDRALAATDAVRALAAVVRPLLLVSEIRTVAADPLWLSPSHDEDCVALHFTWRPDVPGVTAVLPALDDALAPFAARPHWGKVFTTTTDRLHAAYPRLDEFAHLVERTDPAGKFGNDLVDGWLGRGKQRDPVPGGSVLVNTQVFVYECPGCRQTFNAPVVRGSGEHMGMRSEGLGTLAVWSDTYADPNPVDQQIKATLQQVDAYVHADAALQGRLHHAARSAAADPDTDGSRFVHGAMPRCPACGTAPEKFHGSNEHVRQVVPAVTYTRWRQLSASERFDLVRDAALEET